MYSKIFFAVSIKKQVTIQFHSFGCLEYTSRKSPKIFHKKEKPATIEKFEFSGNSVGLQSGIFTGRI
jgi:hypothetical protein